MHGYALTPTDQHLLRSPPPAAALAWAAAAVGAQAAVTRISALEGGTSSAVHAVDVRDRGGAVHELVLRRFVRADWLAAEPDLAVREAAALELTAPGPVPTPALVALDADGAATGVPAVLMTRLPGRVQWQPADLEGYLRLLADALAELQGTPLPAGCPLPAYAPYALEIDGPPPWASQPGVWERALAVFAGPAPTAERRLVHRDYHPGNVLLGDAAVTGVVDWPNASIGPPAADAGHCRANLAGAISQQAADRFLELWLAAGDAGDYHPYWDIVASLGGLTADDLADDWTAGDVEFLARAVAAL